MEKKFDIIIYGASGFTESLGAKYVEKYTDKISWAIAGRDLNKLQKLQEQLKSSPEIIVADGNDEEALIKLTQSTKVVASYAGPFNKYSNLLVKACVKTSTHYVCLLYTSPSPRDLSTSRMPSSA